jgi:hypothetical protein
MVRLPHCPITQIFFVALPTHHVSTVRLDAVRRLAVGHADALGAVNVVPAPKSVDSGSSRDKAYVYRYIMYIY